MRWLFFIAVLSLGLVACGSSGSKPAVHGVPVTFGTEGGNMVPFTIKISATGAVSGTLRTTKSHVAAAVTAAANTDFSGVSNRQCAGTLPDVTSRFVTIGGRSVTVHGGCEPAFEKLWGKLTAAVGIR